MEVRKAAKAAYDSAKVREAVYHSICEVLGMMPQQVVPDADLERDLGADGLDKVEVVMEVESRLGISIPLEATDGMATVEDVVALADRILADRGGMTP